MVGKGWSAFYRSWAWVPWEEGLECFHADSLFLVIDVLTAIGILFWCKKSISLSFMPNCWPIAPRFCPCVPRSIIASSSLISSESGVSLSNYLKCLWFDASSSSTSFAPTPTPTLTPPILGDFRVISVSIAWMLAYRNAASVKITLATGRYYLDKLVLIYEFSKQSKLFESAALSCASFCRLPNLLSDSDEAYESRCMCNNSVALCRSGESLSFGVIWLIVNALKPLFQGMLLLLDSLIEPVICDSFLYSGMVPVLSLSGLLLFMSCLDIAEFTSG